MYVALSKMIKNSDIFPEPNWVNQTKIKWTEINIIQISGFIYLHWQASNNFHIFQVYY